MSNPWMTLWHQGDRIFGNKKKEADFADALIVEKSKSICNEKGESFDGLFTFDIAAQQLNGSKAPK